MVTGLVHPRQSEDQCSTLGFLRTRVSLGKVHKKFEHNGTDLVAPSTQFFYRNFFSSSSTTILHRWNCAQHPANSFIFKLFVCHTGGQNCCFCDHNFALELALVFFVCWNRIGHVGLWNSGMFWLNCRRVDECSGRSS